LLEKGRPWKGHRTSETLKQNKNKKLRELIFASQLEEEQGGIIQLISDEEELDDPDLQIPDPLPVLPLRNTVLFPGVVLPISVGRDKSLRLVREAYRKDRIIGTLSQKDPNVDDPTYEDINLIGTVAYILKILEMPDGGTTVIIQGKSRFGVEQWLTSEPYFTVRPQKLEDTYPDEDDQEFEALVHALKELSLKIINLSSNVPQEASFAVKNIESPKFLINFISANANVKNADKQRLLDISDLKERARLLLEFLTREVQMLEIKRDIEAKVKMDMEQQQREYLLHQQMKTIQDELGGSPIEQEIEELKKRAAEKKWSKEVAKVFEKELDKLQRMNPAVGEYSVQMNYLQTLLDLPWNEYTEDNFDLKRAEKILNEDHYGLEKVKERILEHLAVLKLKGDMKSPILCLYGPPGVGKTSLGRSIARALGRRFVRMSLGGLHDEAEIRGHRKTYIGAMPGRIIQNIRKAKSSNPVFILDEIDKVGSDFKGDPSHALLEVLDPEQNNAFYDNFLELEYDLSRVLFIATANSTETISPALRDRMEMIEISGYIVEEKVEIARRHLIPKQLENHGLDKKELFFPKKVIEEIIVHYTRESGVRTLEKRIAQVIRRVAKKKAFGEEVERHLTLKDVREYLGKPLYTREVYEGNEMPGVVTGLAWTPFGGEILFVETSLSKGKGKLTLTGNLGDVMKESALIALEWVRAHADHLGIEENISEKYDFHIHVPEGAIPKDGPSAGITMVVSLASALTGRRVRKGVALTGEITLRGKVLPVGGIKEKILAAKRAHIKEIILSEENRKDIEEINEIYLKGLTFRYVSNIREVLDHVLLRSRASGR